MREPSLNRATFFGLPAVRLQSVQAAGFFSKKSFNQKKKFKQKKNIMEIKTRTGAVIYESETAENTTALIEEALKSGADLIGANLRSAYLIGADLRNADLSGANLSDANLRGAYLRNADLRCADLSGANLSSADLRGANLRCANLRGANLRCADLRGANLGGANLGGANLCGADLSGANLRNADLRCAYLSGANLRCADLSDADLRGADLRGADLSGAKNIPYITLSCPSDGDFTGWKKVGDKLVRLLIPADAKRSSATTNKCRCEKAKVVAITSLDEGECYEEVTNCNYAETTYKVGEMVYPDSFDDDRWNECSHGIHFFINKQDAINYL